jgi:hypothetical protein
VVCVFRGKKEKRRQKLPVGVEAHAPAVVGTVDDGLSQAVQGGASDGAEATAESQD